MYFPRFLILAFAIVLGACQTTETAKPQYGTTQTSERVATPSSAQSGVAQARTLASICESPLSMASISGYTTGAQEEVSADPNVCPVKRKVLRVFFYPVQTSDLDDPFECPNKEPICRPTNQRALANWFTEVMTRTGTVETWTLKKAITNFELAYDRSLEGTSNVQRDTAPAATDYIMAVRPVLKPLSDPGSQWHRYSYKLTVHVSFVDFRTRRETDAIKVPITVADSDEKLAYVVRNADGTSGLTGFDPTSDKVVTTVHEKLFAEVFEGVANSLKLYFPATGRILDFGKNRFSIDRGRPCGFSEKGETMMVYQMQGRALPIPIAIGTVNPSADNSASGPIACWANSVDAQEIRNASTKGILNGISRRLFAVAVGPPKK